jgi:glutamine cyclotransferase
LFEISIECQVFCQQTRIKVTVDNKVSVSTIRMSQTSILSIKQIIGARSSVVNGIAFQDEQTVVYIAGCYIVLYGVDQKSQRVIPCSPNAQGK